jgi:hypothetical protein
MSEGPYLTAALICEKVIVGKDDVVTVMRIMDSTIIVLPEGTPADFPSDEHRIPVTFDHLVCLKTGKSPGPHTVRIDMVSPSGKENEGPPFAIVLPPEEHGGANITFHQTVYMKHGGLFHFSVFIDDQLATRIPFRIDVVRQAALQPPPPPGAGVQETKALSE